MIVLSSENDQKGIGFFVSKNGHRCVLEQSDTLLFSDDRTAVSLIFGGVS